MFFKLGPLNNFANFTRKHRVGVFFKIKFQASRLNNFVKKRLFHKCFSAKFVTFLRTPFTEHL